ncbi:MAG: TIR domain-containing protein [Caulobacterales bacterium]
MTTPPDIFLSYNREDQARAKLFAEAFEAQGFKVWWDVGLRTGEAYDEVTETALRTAKAVVVLWSKKSVQSRWVRAEATLADRNKTFVPCMIEPCERPIMFELTQTAELSHWDGAPTDKAWVAFLADVQRFIQKSAPAPQADAPSLQSLVQLQPAAPGARTALPADRIGLAVLPFVDLTSAKDQTAFLDGLVEELGIVLSRDDNFALAGAVGVPRDPTRDLKAIAQALGVRYLLDGSVRGSGGRLRVTVRLVAAESGAQLWQERYDGDQTDEFDLQEHVARGVPVNLSFNIVGAEVARIQVKPTQSLTAFEWLALAQALSLDWKRESLGQARAYALEALRLDPGSPLTHACLGWIYSVMYQSSWGDDPGELLRLGLDHSARALNAAERDHRVLLWYFAARTSLGQDMSPVESMLARARARAPDNPALVSALGWAILVQGKRPERALSLIREYMMRDPESPTLSFSLLGEAASLVFMRRFEEAIAPARECVVRRPEYLNAQAVLAAALAHVGQIEEARALVAVLKANGQIERALAIYRDPDERALLREGLKLAGLED